MGQKTPVTAIVDIGKTNKKFFLFDEHMDEITHEYVRFDEIQDDDGFPSENLEAVVNWMKECVVALTKSKEYELKRLNFSTYGASMVHLDGNGEQATPFYNYLKPMEASLMEDFLRKHGLDREQFEAETSSPLMGFLNSGLQLYYLKQEKPELFKTIQDSLHFPQYLSFAFTKKLCSEFTSIGSHTALWHYHQNHYHPWIEAEGFTSIFPKIVSSDYSFHVEINGQPVEVGVGVHDSSSALVPYIQASTEPFVLVSTGTWSICMNYFNEEELSIEHLKKDCLNFLSTKGTNIKASRLFLGKHISEQAKRLAHHFGVDYSTYKTMKFDPTCFERRRDPARLQLDHSTLEPERFGFKNGSNDQLSNFKSYKEAYHHLIDELTDLQIASLKLAIGKTDLKTVYVDGGFSSNEVFMQLLANKLPEYKVYGSSFAKGTALGAALLINKTALPKDYLHKHYNLKLHKAVKSEVI